MRRCLDTIRTLSLLGILAEADRTVEPPTTPFHQKFDICRRLANYLFVLYMPHESAKRRQRVPRYSCVIPLPDP
jgi:hypothetical protein